ncbi:MAG: hypothetical protein WCC66_05555 [Rhizobiaceae bacterium]
MSDLRKLSDALAAFAAANGVLLGTICLFGYVAAITLISIVHPQVNWDLIAYTASAAAPRFADAASLHAYAYDQVRQVAEASQFAALTGSDAYRAHQFANPDAFVSMLGMYKVKALYVGLVQALAGSFGEIGAIRLITTVSTAVTGTVFLLWLHRREALAFAPVIIGLLIISGYGDIARLGTPDAFFMALLSLGLFLHDRGKVWLGALALFMATLVRSDTIVFLAAWAILSLLFNLRQWSVVTAFLASLIAYPLVTGAAGHPGFWPHFVFSTTEQALTMDGFHPAFSVMVYLRAVAIGVVRTLTETSWPAAVALLFPVWVWLKKSGDGLDAKADVLVMALVAGVFGRFILFPLPDTRIHGAYLAPMLMVMLPAITAVIEGLSTGFQRK